MIMQMQLLVVTRNVVLRKTTICFMAAVLVLVLWMWTLPVHHFVKTTLINPQVNRNVSRHEINTSLSAVRPPSSLFTTQSQSSTVSPANQLPTVLSQPSTTRQSTVPKSARKPVCLAGKIPKKNFDLYNDSHTPDVTVVTAYFNLGRFKKGSSTFFDTNLYMKWSRVYRFLKNPFVFYTDSADTAKIFKEMRAGCENITKIILLERTSLWSFSWVDRIRQIYSTPGYPKHHPNTVVPEYSCAQHSKYNVVEETVKHNFFNTMYFTWIDLGYFRDVVNRKKEFVITKPPGFNESQIAMNQVYGMNTQLSADSIFKNNYVSIGGGMFFGSKNTLPTFIADYRHGVESYLNMSLSNTDQQVIYAMNTKEAVVRERVTIQRYISDTDGDCWFYLGYACYRELGSVFRSAVSEHKLQT